MKEMKFDDVTLSIINKNGEQWITASDLANALYPYQRWGQNDTPFGKRIIKSYSHKNNF